MRGIAALGLVVLLVPVTVDAAPPGPNPDPPVRQWSAPHDGLLETQPEIAKNEEGVFTQSVSPPRTIMAGAAMPFVAVSPCRVVDTRAGSGFPAGYGPPSLAGGGAARTFVIPAGPCPGIPTSAGAFSLNFTVVAPAGTPAGGYLSVWPSGSPQPVVSTLNFTSNSILANAAIVPAGAGGAISAFVNFSTDVIIDINGYYVSPASACSATGATYSQAFGGLEFRPGHSGLEYAPLGASIYATAIPAGGQSLRLPLHLPDGAFVTGITFYVVDNDAGNNMTLQLYANTPESESQTALASVTTAALPVSTSVQSVSIAGTPIVTIDNSIRSYLIRYGPGIIGSNHRLVGVRITYNC